MAADAVEGCEVSPSSRVCLIEDFTRVENEARFEADETFLGLRKVVRNFGLDRFCRGV